MTPPLLSRGELMELDVDRLVEKILGLRGDIADDAEEMATLRATITTLTAERDAALSRATAAEARGAEARAEALREAARECAAWVGAEPQSDEWDGGVRACVGSIADLAEADALAAKGGAR